MSKAIKRCVATSVAAAVLAVGILSGLEAQSYNNSYAKRSLLPGSSFGGYGNPYRANQITPYVGVEYQYSLYDINNTLYEDDAHGINGYAGLRFSRGWGIEIGAESSLDEESRFTDSGTSITTETEIQHTTFYLDALGYYGLTRELEFIGSLGVGYTKAMMQSTTSGVTTDETEDGASFRIGAGFQYNFNETYALRAMARYHVLNFGDIVDDRTSYSIGYNVKF